MSTPYPGEPSKCKEYVFNENDRFEGREEGEPGMFREDDVSDDEKFDTEEGCESESDYEEEGSPAVASAASAASVQRDPETEANERVDKITRALLSSNNVFLSGPGGTGKSYMLKNVFTRLREFGKRVYKTGSTGVSAESIGGMTLHSWAGVMLGDKSAETYYNLIKTKNKNAHMRWLRTSILIIDEISMTGGEFFQKLSDLGKLIRGVDKPFGGITLLICGDVCQLPPVNDRYFFQTKTYDELCFKPMRLTHPWRFQGAKGAGRDDFFGILSRVRIGAHTVDDMKILEARVQAYKEISSKKYVRGEIRPTQMFSKRIDVANMNAKELAALPSEEYTYVCYDELKRITKDSSGKIETFKAMMDKSVEPSISLKSGAQVMLNWNLDVENGLCNGSRGVVLECLDDCVLVRFRNGIEQLIHPNSWTIETDHELFTRTQIPLILAWSTTIHKSQSSTLDFVIIDLGTSLFSPNMGYVALSRCRSLEGVFITNLMPSKIVCDSAALEFEKFLIELEKSTKW